MNAAITLQVVTHAILWILIFSLEMVGAVVMHLQAGNASAFIASFFFTLFSFGCLYRLGKTALLRDLQELHLYDVFAQVFGLILIWLKQDLFWLVLLAGTIVFLKFFRILWINPRVAFGTDSGWAVFGIVGYLHQRHAKRSAQPLPIGDKRVYALIPIACALSLYFNLTNFLHGYILIGVVTILLIIFYFHKIINFLKNAELERIQASQKLAVASATAAINAELSEKNKQLHAANLERDVMLADLMVRNECLRDASHDLAAPAFWITSCTQQLVSAQNDAARHELALQLFDSVHHYNQLLQATIHSAKLMTKIEMPKPVPISVNRLANYLWDKYLPIFEEKGLRFGIYKANQYVLAADGSVSADIHPERQALRFSVACDEQVLMRILNNLLMNALRNTPSGRVGVAFRKRQHDICWIEVRDTGSGFSDADSADWQDNFNRVAMRIKGGKMKASEAASHGLGINNMKNLCASIGSTMLLYSRPEQGTLFRFSLPIIATQDNDMAATLEMAEEFVP